MWRGAWHDAKHHMNREQRVSQPNAFPLSWELDVPRQIPFWLLAGQGLVRLVLGGYK